MQLREKLCCWRFEKVLVLQKKLSFWPSEVALPFSPAPCSGAVRNSCLGIWFAELEVNDLPALDSSCDPDDSVVWTSIFRSDRTLPCWGKLGSCKLCSFGAMYALFLMTTFWDNFFGKLLSVPRAFGSVFHDQWDKTFRQGEVVISKSASFFLIKDALLGLHLQKFVLLAVASERVKK